MMVFVVNVVICSSLMVMANSASDFPVGLNTVEMVAFYGYPIETHYVTTEDGYILGLHRIPHGKNATVGRKPAILLVHGLMSSSADYVNMGPNKSLSYVLADSGYDVWISNARGTYWSKNHTKYDINLSADAEKYWDFSWHEIGFYDNPAIVDYILGVTGQEGLYYVGHSQGTTTFFVMTSTRPEYNKKIKYAALMAPSAIFTSTSRKTIILMQIIHFYEIVLKNTNLYRLYNFSWLRKSMQKICFRTELLSVCETLLFQFVGKSDRVEFNQKILPVIFSNCPADASSRQFLHYSQLMTTGIFAQYDFGTKVNIIKYGRKKPPVYDLGKINVPMALYYGSNDDVISIEDVQKLMSLLQNVSDNYLVPYDYFNHLDFLFATDVFALLYKQVLKDIEKGPEKHVLL